MYRKLSVITMALALSSAASAQTADEWYKATGKTCSTIDVTAAKAVQVKADKYNASTMTSPDSAKLIALCAVPGQITSAEMKETDGRANYTVTIIPNKKKTHTKVVVDAQSGAGVAWK